VRSGQAHDLIDELLDGGRRGEWVRAGALEVRWDGGDLFQIREHGGPERAVRGASSVAACLTCGYVIPSLVRSPKVDLRATTVARALRRRGHPS
jgi:hypothetical protein